MELVVSKSPSILNIFWDKFSVLTVCVVLFHVALEIGAVVHNIKARALGFSTWEMSDKKGSVLFVHFSKFDWSTDLRLQNIYQIQRSLVEVFSESFSFRVFLSLEFLFERSYCKHVCTVVFENGLYFLGKLGEMDEICGFFVFGWLWNIGREVADDNLLFPLLRGCLLAANFVSHNTDFVFMKEVLKVLILNAKVIKFIKKIINLSKEIIYLGKYKLSKSFILRFIELLKYWGKFIDLSLANLFIRWFKLRWICGN